ncbi:MAG: hypothetical protein U5N85_03715 [Arcicella sp.]|nr:hypothetical protein [Arcicella sp.]
MLLPKNLKLLTFSKWNNNAPYVPFGFLDFDEESDGAGSYYGLYWFYGREDMEPVVCWYEHEIWSLEITHNCLDDFLVEFGYSESNSDNLDIYDSGSEFLKAKLKAQKGDLDNCILQMNVFVNHVPEDSEAWGILADVHRRKGDTENADKMALKSILSNWSFGFPTQKSIQQFKKINQNGSLSNDSLVKRLNDFELTASYNELSMSYDVVKQAIDEYYEKKEYINALILEHNYALMISNETSSFQFKNDFNVDIWKEQFQLKCEKYLNRSTLSFEDIFKR